MDEIEKRLAAASQAVREHDLCAQRHRQLSARGQTAAAELDQIVAVTDRLEDMARERWRLLAR